MIYKGVSIRVQGTIMTIDLYALLLVGTDMVLGVQWLEGLGQVVSNYGKGMMKFKWGDRMVTLTTGVDD